MFPLLDGKRALIVCLLSSFLHIKLSKRSWNFMFVGAEG